MNDFERLLDKARTHALAYRGAEKPLAHDYHAMRRRIAAPVPETGTDAGAVIDELAALAEGGLMPITGPRFFGWVMGASPPAGVAADWLVSAWGQNAGYHT